MEIERDDMTPATSIPGELLRWVPGCERGAAPLRVTPLAQHAVNRTLRVSTSAGDFVVRLSSMPDAWLQADRSQEFMLQSLAAQAGIAPAIIHQDASRGWLLMPFIDEPTWSERDFADVDALARLGRVLGRLHGLKAPPQARLDVMATLQAYRVRLDVANPGHLDPRMGRWLDAAARALQQMEEGGRTPAILHHDLHAANLLGRKPWLIDWECAVVGDPLLDIACVLAYAPQSRPQVSVLLDAAGLGGTDPSQLRSAVFVFELHTWLWYRERATRMPPTPGEQAAAAAYESRLGLIF